jgi:FAD/FMN-containing dehydrogenase/SAM-dependent methyltransferase
MALYDLISSKRKIRPINKYNSKIMDDVSGMNGTIIERIFEVHSTDDIKNIIVKARNENKTVSAFGKKHTMGGQCISKHGFIIDTKYFNHILNFNEEKLLVTVEPGLIWADLIKYLNNYGFSPMTLQSYSTFSVGGSISVNAHGITNDYALYNSIESLKIMDSSGEVINCSRLDNTELFSLAIGGYGLFGIITEVTLRIVKNTQLKLTYNVYDMENFKKHYIEAIENDSVDIKLGRINITNMDQLHLFEFIKSSSQKKVVSKLNDSPNKPSVWTLLIYKWLVPHNWFQQLRYKLERIINKPLDWNDYHERNQLLYESAEPLARLYGNLINIDRTHILQEYFVPNANFEEFVHYLRYMFQNKTYNYCTLLNITIRYVKKDDVTYLPYASQDMFAFVLYYRIQRKPEADLELEIIQQSLIDATIKLNGTFYLPYRHHYTYEQMKLVYPSIEDFSHLKIKYDPIKMFTNNWFDKYFNDIYDNSKFNHVMHPVGEIVAFSNKPSNPSIDSKFNSLLSTSDGYIMMTNFLKYVLNIVPYDKIIDVLKENITGSEDEIYNAVKTYASNYPSYKYFYNTLKNLESQKTELVNQTLSLLNKCNIQNTFSGHLSIGDPGRYVRKLNFTGETYILHNERKFTDIIENGTPIYPGKFIKFNYNDVDTINIPTNSIDIITCFIGMHHFNDLQLNVLLDELRRVLKPGGIFILREHNCHPQLEPMVTSAHAIYNAITQVNIDDEYIEYRHFRPLLEWRNMFAQYDLIDEMRYEFQEHDPTENYLMCFRNAKKTNGVLHADIKAILNERPTYKREQYQTYFTLAEWYLVDIVKEMGKFMEHTPYYKYPSVITSKLYWNLFYKLVAISYKKSGFKVLTSAYMLAGIVMGLTNTLLLSLLSILSIIPNMIYGSGDNMETDRIELVCSKNPREYYYSISQSIKVLASWDKYDLIEVPRYKPFTDIIVKLVSNKNTIYEIAGNDTIHMKLKCSKEHVNILKNNKMKILLEYEPTTQELGNNICYVSLDVEMHSLDEIIKISKDNGIEIEHIYDY